MSVNKYDILIIGAGAVGCALAWELSRFDVRVGVIEKNSDVAGETTGRNSAVVHAGFNNRPGSLMAKFCVEGNQGFEALAAELGVPYKKTGKLVVALNQEDVASLEKLYDQGVANGCQGLEIIDAARVAEMMPGVGGYKALWSPETAITSPFLYCVALANNAAVNGVDFFLDHEVTAINRVGEEYHIVCGKNADTGDDEVYVSNIIVNCAGLGAAHIASMAGVDKYAIYPCRGQYYILDVDKDGIVEMPVYPAPQAGIGGLGVHLTPTIEGNVIIGPSAEYIEENDDYSATADVMEKLYTEALQLLPAVKALKPIGNYAGIRPKQAPPGEGGYWDFVISEDLPGLINLIGIESPGLTASIPIARHVIELIKKGQALLKKCQAPLCVPLQPTFRNCSFEEQAQLIKDNPEYGDIVCRCRKITKAEIRAAIENPLGVKTVSGIKYRAWATTGRCNGGYCLPKIAEILVEEYGLNPEEIRYRNEGSEMFTGAVK